MVTGNNIRINTPNNIGIHLTNKTGNIVDVSSASVAKNTGIPRKDVSFEEFFEHNVGQDNFGKLVLIGDENLGFEYGVAGTPSAFMTAIKYLDKKHAVEGWHYGKGLLYDNNPTKDPLNFEKTLNNPNKASCCATYVSQALYLSGYFTDEDLTFGGVFNPNYQVYIDRKMKEFGYKKVTNVDELQEADIIFYNTKEDHKADHVDVCAYRNPETGELWIYSEGTDEGIKELGPKKVTENEYGKYLWGDWWAYRLPDMSRNESGNQDE